MSDIAIRVENLSKQYRIGARQAAYRTLREALTDAFTAPFRRNRNPQSAILRLRSGQIRNPQFIWALKDVSFEVKRGEVVGIPSQAQDRHRAQWGGEDDAAQGPLPHHRADGGLR